MADDLEAVDRALLSACDLAEAAPLIEARGRLLCELIRQASHSPTPDVSCRLKAALDMGERISARLARMRGQINADFRRAEQCSQILR
jgi:hypothetical protein